MTKQILTLLKDNKEFYNSFREDFTYHSSAIEGSTVTKEEHHQLAKLNRNQTINQIKDIDKIKKEDAIENLNCLKLFDYVFNHLDESLSHQSICEYQEILKSDTQFQINLPKETGAYRKNEVKIGSHHPPASFKVYELMKQLINNFNYRQTLLIDDIAEFHAQFEHIHPFRDGNGRIGRIIAFKQCLINNIIPFIVNKETRSTYINCLEIYQVKTDTMPLTKYFLDQQKVFMQKYGRHFNTDIQNNLTINEISVINYLKTHKYANRAEIQKHINLKIAATKNLLSKMMKTNLLKIIGKSKNSKYIIND